MQVLLYINNVNILTSSSNVTFRVTASGMDAQIDGGYHTIWTYSGSGTFLGFSTTEGATTPDTRFAVGHTGTLATGSYYYIYSVEEASQPTAKTVINGLTPVKKMFGITEIVKEVVNGVTVYEKQTPTPSGFNVTYSTKGSVYKGGQTTAYLYFNGTTTQYWRMVDNFSAAYNAKVYDENGNEVSVGSVRQNVTSIRYAASPTSDTSTYWKYSGTSTKLPTTDTALTGDINVTGQVGTVD